MGVERDVKTAMEYYTQAATQGHSNAQYCLGYLFEVGGIEPAGKRTQLSRHSTVSPLIKSGGGGGGVERDALRALQWYEKAAEENHPAATYRIGTLFETGVQGAGGYNVIERDLQRALQCYLKSAEMDYPAAQYALGCLYQYGVGVTRDVNAAVEFYQKSVAKGYAEAQCNLGYLFCNCCFSYPRFCFSFFFVFFFSDFYLFLCFFCSFF